MPIKKESRKIQIAGVHIFETKTDLSDRIRKLILNWMLIVGDFCVYGWYAITTTGSPLYLKYCLPCYSSNLYLQ